MRQTVDLSDALVRHARETEEVGERTVSAQIEFWAGLDRAIDT